MTEAEYKAKIRNEQLQRKADALFAACIAFLISKSELHLQTISQLSAELLKEGYTTSFEHKRRALIIHAFVAEMCKTLEEDLDKVAPRQSDLEVLPNAS